MYKIKFNNKYLYYFLFLLIGFVSCRTDIIIFPYEEEPVTSPEFTSILGFYLLNEGNMGNNKSTLDYFNCETGTYHRNIYADVNPSVPKELGDVGNDIIIYGSKMYAILSCSNKIEVMEAKTAKRIGQVDIPNCRNITFYDSFVYITSYAGPVQHNPTLQQAGYVAKIDTASLQVLERCVVGQQPDGLAIANNKIYIANSGGYLSPNYENTVSIIDITSFTEIKRLVVAINIHRVCADKHGNIWVTSRGDYLNSPAKLYCIDSKSDKITDSIQIAAANFHLDGDKLYLVGSGWNSSAMQDKSNFGIVDVVTKQIISTQFITDGTEAKIGNPYGISVNPITKDIYVTDAHYFVSPGTLYCFNKEGKKKWEVRTGDIPGHFAFYGKY
ncbi:MAG: YncE family protein [Bacteroidales bacterium]|jgi:DNA-binding beta-propeller fold protein YncE|nr:YncE family protein [Bacteroidales bacterium]